LPATWPPSVGLFLLGAVNSVVDVAMNAHGVTVERRLGRPVMPGFHAMYSLGGTAGAVLGALAAGAGLGRTPHFLLIVLAGVAVAVPATGMLLPSRADAAGQAGSGGGRRRGALVTDLLGAWSGRTLALGVLSFCLLLAEGSVHDWAAVYLRDGVGATAGLAAARVATFTAAMTAGRLAGGRVAARLGPVTAFRSGALLACIGFGVALLVGTPWPAWPAWDCSGRPVAHLPAGRQRRRTLERRRRHGGGARLHPRLPGGVRRARPHRGPWPGRSGCRPRPWPCRRCW
jgi:hypothetical protein